MYEDVSKSFRTESKTKYMLTTLNSSWEATQRVTAAKLTTLTHKIPIQLHLVAESCTISSSRSRRPVRKLLDTPSYTAWVYVQVRTKFWLEKQLGYKPIPQLNQQRHGKLTANEESNWPIWSHDLGLKTSRKQTVRIFFAIYTEMLVTDLRNCHPSQ
jgi:hypothetical protein